MVFERAIARNVVLLEDEPVVIQMKPLIWKKKKKSAVAVVEKNQLCNSG